MYVKELINLHNVRPIGILHVGAHLAEENSEYRLNKYDNGGGIIWVEAIPKIAEEIKSKLDPRVNKVYCAAIWNQEGKQMEFNVASQTASSSLLEFGLHKKTYPDIDVTKKIVVTTKRLDTLLSSDDLFELVVLDIQGAEDRAIESLGNRINEVKYIYMEISRKELYLGTKLVKEMDDYLDRLGFIRVFTAWDRRAKWGDALYVRKEIYLQTNFQKIRSKIRIFQRFVRQWVPLGLFPILVKCKRILRIK